MQIHAGPHDPAGTQAHPRPSPVVRGERGELRSDSPTTYGNRRRERVLGPPSKDLEGVSIPFPRRSLRCSSPTRRFPSYANWTSGRGDASDPTSGSWRSIPSARARGRISATEDGTTVPYSIDS